MEINGLAEQTQMTDDLNTGGGPNLLHIFRNDPLGRENLLQSIYFCRTLGMGLTVCLPQSRRLRINFDQGAVRLQMDNAGRTEPSSAADRVMALTRDAGLKPKIVRPQKGGMSLRDEPGKVKFISGPFDTQDHTAKIGLGYTGKKIRPIIRVADFPVLLPSPVFKPWKSVAVLFGGSQSAVHSLRYGIQIAKRSGFPLDLFIQQERNHGYYNRKIQEAHLEMAVARHCNQRHEFAEGKFANNLYAIPHDALVVLGAYGHGMVKNYHFGSKMETVLATLTNNLLVCGPKAASRFSEIA